MTNEDKIYSNDYADIVGLTGDLNSSIVESEGIYIHYIGKYSFIYVPRSTLMQNSVSSRGFEPFVMGLCQSWLTDTGIERVLEQSTLGVDGTGVLLGIIDTGINYTDAEFLYPNGDTKIAAVWDQENRDGEPPAGYIYGTEFERAAINAAMENGEQLSFLDRNGHGTRLAKTALSASPRSELIAVKLKQAKPYLMSDNLFNDTLAFESGDLMAGIDYIVNKAQELGRPVSIIIGIGTTQGAHNGVSLLEQFINEISLRTGVCIVTAAGNEGLSQHHYYSSVHELSRTIELNVSGSSGFTLWLWNDFLCRMSVGASSPLGEVIQPVQPVNLSESRFIMPLGSGSVSIQYRLPVDEKQLSVVTVQNPVSGIWRLNLSFSRTGLCALDAWLPMSQFLNGSVTFINPSTASTAVVPSTAPLVISVGGYNTSTGGIYENTGRGPNARGVLKPDFTAPAADILGGSGTSASAAITAGAAALLLQWGIVLGNNPAIKTEIIKTYLISGAEQPTPNLETDAEGFPNNLWGFGKINLYNTFRQIF
ncbi:MAG: S8 family peptidase [Firmicutes bacterium]|nr:S8 family peptidase [Bacillota bacterium]